MTTISAVQGVLPPHRYPQAQLTDLFVRLCLPDSASRAVVERFHANTRVATRHLALPIEEYTELDGFTAANNAFLSVAVDLGCEAVLGALAAAGLKPADVDVVMSTTVTGIAVPSLDARIAARIGMRPDVKRIPMSGLDCLAGAAGVARLHDILLGAPSSVAVLVSVELCSLTLQRQDLSTANMIASGLFGDGAAAVVAVGADHPRGSTGPRVVDTASHLYPDSERAMGWDVGSTGLKIVLGAEAPDLVRTHLADDVQNLLSPHGLVVDDVSRWICHPGGPKVIETIQSVLGLGHDDLAMTWNSLNRIGNLSSASVLHVLADTLAERPAEAGDWGVLMAMGAWLLRGAAVAPVVSEVWQGPGLVPAGPRSATVLWAEVGRVIARPLTETTHRFVPLRLRARWGALRWIQEIMTSGTPATAAEWLAAVASIQALNDSDQA